MAAAQGLQTGEGTPYDDLFGDISIEAAMLEIFFRAAQLSGLLFCENANQSVRTTDAEAVQMAMDSNALGVCVQVFYGPVHTTKLHRFMHHLLAEMRGHGNLWEGDPSENEIFHKTCKRMYRRSNKRGPSLALQMMRCDVTQGSILREVLDEDGDDEDVVPDEDDSDSPSSPYDSFMASAAMGAPPASKLTLVAEPARAGRAHVGEAAAVNAGHASLTSATGCGSGQLCDRCQVGQDCRRL